MSEVTLPSSSNSTYSYPCDEALENIESNEHVVDFLDRLDDLNCQLNNTPNAPKNDHFLSLILENIKNTYKHDVACKEGLKKKCIKENPDETEEIKKAIDSYLRMQALSALQNYSAAYINRITSMLPDQRVNHFTQNNLIVCKNIIVFNRENPPNTPLSPALKKEFKSLVAELPDIFLSRENQFKKNIQIITKVCQQQIKTIKEIDEQTSEILIKTLTTRLNKVIEENAIKQGTFASFAMYNLTQRGTCCIEMMREVEREKEEADKATLEAHSQLREGSSSGGGDNLRTRLGDKT